MEEKEISWISTNGRMELVLVKEGLSLFHRIHHFALHSEGDGRLQRAIEDVINLVEGITIRSKKQT